MKSEMHRDPFRDSFVVSLLLSSLLIVLAAGPAFAQEAGSEPIFIDRVDVNVVNVEVFVTDSKGRRVTGLTRDDFELYEDGKPIEISNFYAFTREDRVLRDLEKGSEALLEDSGSETLRPLPEDQQLNLLVYVDNFNLRPQDRKRVLDELDTFLEDRMAQGDNVMIVAYNRGIDVIEPFTRDRGRVTDALRRLGKTSTYRQVDDAERRRLIRYMLSSSGGSNNPLAAPAPDDLSVAYQYVRSYVQSSRNDLRQAAASVNNVVRSLAGLPGRKAMLYVSDGLPQRPGEELYQMLVDIYGTNTLGRREGSGPSKAFIDPSIEALKEDESQLFNAITREANAHQVTLYTLDARGPNGDSTLSPEFPTLSAGNGGRSSVDSIRLTNLQEPLINMAGDTGGMPILNTATFDRAFATMGDDFDSFYSLGYRSPKGGDGGYHKIEVKAKGEGLKIRHRSGYVDKPEIERVADRTLSSLLLDLGKNPLGIEVDFGTPEKKSRNRYLLPILVRIPFREITLLPNGAVEEGRLQIFLVVQDEEGGVSELYRFPYPLTVPQDQVATARDREIGYQTTLEIRGGTPKVAVAVWDELSGSDSYIYKRVLVGKEKKKGKKRRNADAGR